MSTPPNKKAKRSKVFEPGLHTKTHQEICDARGTPLELGKGCEVIDLALQHYDDESFCVIILLRGQNTGAGYARAIPFSKLLPQTLPKQERFLRRSTEETYERKHQSLESYYQGYSCDSP